MYYRVETESTKKSYTYSKKIQYLQYEPEELGKRDNCCDNLTSFSGQQMVSGHISAEFWLRGDNIFYILACHKNVILYRAFFKFTIL